MPKLQSQCFASAYTERSVFTSKLLLQVHDELVFEVDEAIADQLAKQIQATMEKVVTLSIPLVVEVGKGNNWDEAH